MTFSDGYEKIKSQLGFDIAESILECGDAGIWLWNVQTGETVFNEKWAKIIGFCLADLQPVSIETWLNHAHPDDLPRSQALLEAHFNGLSERYICEARMKHKNGHWVKVLDKGQVKSWDKHGKPEWMFGVHIDITEQWQKECEVESLHNKLQRFTDNLPGFVYQHVIDKYDNESFPFASSKVKDIYGCSAEQILQNAELAMQAVHPDDLQRVEQSIADSKTNLTQWHQVYRINHPIKGVIWVEGKSSPIAQSDGCIEWNGYLEDVTDEVKRNEKIKLLTAVFSTTSRGILITTPEPKIVDVNPAFERITGYKKEDVVGKSPATLSAKQQPAEFYAAMWKELLLSGRWQGEVWNKRKSGEVFPEMLSIDALYDEAGCVSHYIGAFDDISSVVEKRQFLTELVNQDPLTKLLNRRGLDIQLHAFMQDKQGTQPFAIIYIDLDNFKLVNDTFGHEQGDNLLITISEQLLLQLREQDILARIGGDEFVVILPSLSSLKLCNEVAMRCTEAVKRAAKKYHTPYPVSVSYGISLYPINGNSIKALLQHADEMMYKMKQQHKV